MADENGAPLAINGRFLAQPVTGVQRYAMEVARAAERLAARGEWPECEILAPNVPAERLGEWALPVRTGGRFKGHAWEQLDLPGLATGVTLNLGNTAPLRAASRQIVVIHDAGAFDTPGSYGFKFRTWYRVLHQGLSNMGATIATVSAFSRRRLAARLGRAEREIHVVGEGADHMDRIAPDPGVLERHGLAPRRFAVAVGSRAAHKNLGSLAGAARELERRGMALAVAGAIDPDVFRTGADGLAFPIVELGRVSDEELRALYENAVCLLFPSLYEGFGLPPVEALACGCPVVAAGGHAVEEICGDAALVYDPGASDGALAPLARLLDEAGLHDEMSARGRAKAATLTWENAARDLKALAEAER